jgi:hypothetical protein
MVIIKGINQKNISIAGIEVFIPYEEYKKARH